MSEDNEFRRRKVLSTTGSLAVGTIALAGRSTADVAGVDTDFDPNNRKELREFLQDYRAKLDQFESEDRASEFKKQVAEELSDEQSAAIAEFFSREGELAVTVKNENSTAETSVGTLSSDGFYSYSYTVAAEINTVLGTFDAFEYTHEIDWEVSGGDVVECTSRQGGYKTYSHLNALYWSFESSKVRSKDVDDTNCEATRFAKFSRNFVSGDIASTTDTTTITLVGDNNGSGGAPRVLINGEDISKRR